MALLFLTFILSETEKIEHLYNKYKKLLLYKAYGICKDYVASEDIVSETYEKIYKNIKKIDDVDSKESVSFLCIVLKNTALNYIRKVKNHIPLDRYEESISDGSDIEDLVITEDVVKDVLSIVDTLKEELKAPFLLKYSHGLSHKEIANLLGISENNVTVRIHRAKAKIIKIIKEGGYYEI